MLTNWDEQAFNSGKFKFVGRLPLQGLGAGVADVPDTEKDKVLFAFQLITPTTSTLLMANTQDEKVAWMNDLDECIYALLEKERSRKRMSSVIMKYRNVLTFATSWTILGRYPCCWTYQSYSINCVGRRRLHWIHLQKG